MERKNNLFFNLLKELHKEGVLNELILIGGWCHLFYRHYFNNAPEIPAVRTLDIDFLVPNPFRTKKEVNIPELLEKLDFTPVSSYSTGYTKYVHPELELEFLTPELGKGRDKPYIISSFHIQAQGLRFLNFLQAHAIKINYENIEVRVPEPSAYVLHKFIIFERRVKKDKKERDIESAREIGKFLLNDDNQKKKLKQIFNEIPKKWQNKIKSNLKENSVTLHEFLYK